MTNLCQKVALVGVAAVAVAATVIIAESASAQSFTICESINFRPNECRINTRRGVVLERELSRASCIRGRDWGYSGGFVWVANGCRAVFQSVGADWVDSDRPDLYCPPEAVYHPPRRRPRRRVRRPRRSVVICH